MSAPIYRVFLSHSSADKKFVRELYDRLTHDGVSCFFDIESIGWGQNWVTALERALKECEIVVFILSPDFCTSEWVQVERTSSLARDPAGLRHKVRPLMLRACRHLPDFPFFLHQVQTIDVSTIASFEASYPRICRELGGTPRNDTTPADRTKLPPVTPLPERHRMPYRSLGEKFVGRADSFWKLHDSLFRDGTTILAGEVVVVGTGGLGKTQLAIEYTYRFGSAYPGGIYWVDAARGLSTLVSQVGEAAGIEVDGKADEIRQAEQIWSGLNRLRGPALLILDNFPENAPLQPYLPVGGSVHTLITTRRQDLGYSSVRLNVLSTEEGVRLLNSGERQFDYNDAAPLVDRVGGLPLALELARGYLNYRRILTIPELLEEMNATSEMELLKEFASEYRDHLPSLHTTDIAATFQLSWDAAPELGRTVLRAMGELAPVGVPRSLLRSALNLPSGTGVRDQLARALDELCRLSLIELDISEDPIAHRLVLAFARRRYAADSASSFDQCLSAIQEQMNRASLTPDAGTILELNRLVPHVEFLLAERLIAKEFSNLADRLGAHYRILGRYADAKRVLMGALASAEKTFEPGHPSIAISQSNLALVLQDLGQMEEARDLLRKALASHEKTFEPGHPSIAISQSNLAMVLQDLGQMEEARDLLRKALASDEKTFEPGHPSIAIRQSNLAMVLRDLGQMEEARDLLRKALASDEKTFEPGHPSIAVRQSNLAMVLRDLGQMDEARDLLRKALASDEKTFEPGHPSIAISQSNLAMVLQDLGQMEEARDLLRKALASDEKTFEPGHPSIGRSQSNLATVLQDLGQIEEARDLLRKALASAEKTFEPGHPSIAIRQSNLAMVLRDLGQMEEARDLLRKALASDEKTFEPGHPSIGRSQSNLAMVLKDLGQMEEARDLLRKALASDEKTFEPGHPSIGRSQSNLAMVLKDLGQMDEARDLLRKALASDEKTFEPGHPSIAIRQSNLAMVLRDLGQMEEARDLLRKALASDEKTFEPGHPSIAIRQSNLAMVLRDLGQMDEARDLLRKALASAEKTFEPGHPSIAISQSNLALVLQDLGQMEEARDLLRKAHQIYLSGLGPDHPGTQTIRRNLELVGL